MKLSKLREETHNILKRYDATNRASWWQIADSVSDLFKQYAKGCVPKKKDGYISIDGHGGEEKVLSEKEKGFNQAIDKTLTNIEELK